MKIKKILSIVCMFSIMAFCTACSGLPEASGDDDPEAAVHQSAFPVPPETTGNNEHDEKMDLIRSRARAMTANFILAYYVFYEGNPEYLGRFYVGEDYMLHVQLSEITDEVKETLNEIFDDYADAVVYESFDTPVNEIQPTEYIGHNDILVKDAVP